MTALLAASTITSEAQEAVKNTFINFKPWYNAFEHALPTRGRLLTNFDLQSHNIEVGYHSLNELTLDALAKDIESHFNRHVITAGLKNFKLIKLAEVIVDTDDKTDLKHWLRFNFTWDFADKKWIYWSFDVVFNNEGANATLFFGKEFKELWNASLEVYHNAGRQYKKNADGKYPITDYTELQFNLPPINLPWLKLELFVRGEMVGIGFWDNVYILGLKVPVPLK